MSLRASSGRDERRHIQGQGEKPETQNSSSYSGKHDGCNGTWRRERGAVERLRDQNPPKKSEIPEPKGAEGLTPERNEESKRELK